jgi:hypothetical protein
MRGAWFIVETYCFLSFLHVLSELSRCSDDPVLLAVLLGEFALVLLLSWLTFRGKRLASRILAVFIAASAVYFVWARIIQVHPFDVYNAYMLLVQLYFFGGAIMLWRIKELPTRFTDPPAEPTAHA